MPVTTTTSVSGYKVHTGTLQEVLDALGSSGVGTQAAQVICMFVNGAGFSVLVRQ